MIPLDILKQIGVILQDKDPNSVAHFLRELEVLSPENQQCIKDIFGTIDTEARHTAKLLQKDSKTPLSQKILDDKKKRGKRRIKSLTKGRPPNLAGEVIVSNVVLSYTTCFGLPQKSRNDSCLKILHLLLNTEESPWHPFLKAIDDLS